MKKLTIIISMIMLTVNVICQENRIWEGINAQGQKTVFTENSCLDWTQQFDSKTTQYKKIQDNSNGIMLKSNEQTLFLSSANCQKYIENNKSWEVVFNGKWNTSTPNQKFGCLSGDCLNGYGVYKYSDALYSGFFKNSKRNGLGELRFNDCLIQTGVYSNDTCCKDMYTEEDPSRNTMNFINRAKNSKDYYCLKLTKNNDNVYFAASFYAMINGKYFDDWGSIDSIEFPKPTFKLNTFKSNEYLYGEPRFYNDGKYMIYCTSLDGTKDGMTKSWFKVVDITSGNTVKTYGNSTAPIKASGYGRLEIKEIIDNYLVFDYDVESNGSILKKETKVLDLNGTTIQALTNKHPIFNSYYNLKAMKIEKNGPETQLVFRDSLGVKKKSILYKNCDISILAENNIFFTVIGRETAQNPDYTYYTKQTFIETYNNDGIKVDSCSFKGYVHVNKHPTQFKYVVSYIEGENSKVSEFSIANLDSLIQNIRIQKSKTNEAAYYSPTGKFVIIGKALYHNNRIYFGLLGIPHFLNNDNSLIFDDGDYLYYYNLISGKLIWILNKQKVIQGPTVGGTTYRPVYKTYCTEGYIVLIGTKYSGDKFHLKIKIDNQEQTFDEVVKSTNTKLLEESNKNNSTQSTSTTSNDNSNNSVGLSQSRTCTYKFVKPKLNVTWNDNRIGCCNPNCRYWAGYYENKKSNLENAEIEYLNNLLKAHFIENNCDDTHKALDFMALNEFIVSNYYGWDMNNSVGQSLIAIGTAGSVLSYAYENAFSNMSIFGYQESTSEKLKRLKSKNKIVNIYNVQSKYCSKYCKEYCEIFNIKCNNR